VGEERKTLGVICKAGCEEDLIRKIEKGFNAQECDATEDE
jgi:hypothetical protein